MEWTKIVLPQEAEVVLRDDGSRSLTLVTCCPLYYVGSLRHLRSRADQRQALPGPWGEMGGGSNKNWGLLIRTTFGAEIDIVGMDGVIGTMIIFMIGVGRQDHHHDGRRRLHDIMQDITAARDRPWNQEFSRQFQRP